MHRYNIACPICSTSGSSIKQIILSCYCLVCIDCISRWLELKITENNYSIESYVPCIFCGKTSPLQRIYKKLPTLNQEKLNESLLQVYLTKSPDVRRCPKGNCKYAGIIKSNSSCMSPLQCALCGTTWRDKQQYTKFDKVLEWFKTKGKEKQSQQWIESNSKKCPSCHINIEKNGGCDHMICKQCKYQFCWTNLQKYPESNEDGATNENLNLNQVRAMQLNRAKARKFSLKRFNPLLRIIKFAILLILSLLFKDLISSACEFIMNVVSFVFKGLVGSVFAYIVNVILAYSLREISNLIFWILSSCFQPILNIWVLNGFVVISLLFLFIFSRRHMKIKYLTRFPKEEKQSSRARKKYKKRR